MPNVTCEVRILALTNQTKCPSQQQLSCQGHNPLCPYRTHHERKNKKNTYADTHSQAPFQFQRKYNTTTQTRNAKDAQKKTQNSKFKNAHKKTHTKFRNAQKKHTQNAQMHKKNNTHKIHKCTKNKNKTQHSEMHKTNHVGRT